MSAYLSPMIQAMRSCVPEPAKLAKKCWRRTIPYRSGGASMIGWSIVNRQARVALDVDIEVVRFNNPTLPNTRSEMAIPIVREQICLGALSIQSDQPNAFDQNDIQILQGIADLLAITLENTRLFQQISGILG